MSSLRKTYDWGNSIRVAGKEIVPENKVYTIQFEENLSFGSLNNIAELGSRVKSGSSNGHSVVLKTSNKENIGLLLRFYLWWYFKESDQDENGNFVWVCAL
jgi:hypothetical protein